MEMKGKTLLKGGYRQEGDLLTTKCWSEDQFELFPVFCGGDAHGCVNGNAKLLKGK